MIKQPASIDELYAFFVPNLAKPPVKSHVAYVGGKQYIREDWVISTVLDRYNRYGLWFHFKESDPARWHEVYEKYKS